MDRKMKVMFYLSLMIGLLALSSLIVPSLAGANAADPTEASQLSVTGTIVSVDVENKTLTVAYATDVEQLVTETALFQLAEDAGITKNGEAISLSMLNEGDQVTLQYHADESGNKVIDVLSVGS